MTTTKTGVKDFAKKLAKFIIVPLRFDDSKNGSSWYIKLLIKGINIEIMGELIVKGDHDQISSPKGTKIWNNIIYKNFRGLPVPLLPELCLIGYFLFSGSTHCKGYRKDLIHNLINENHLSTETINRIKKYLPI